MCARDSIQTSIIHVLTTLRAPLAPLLRRASAALRRAADACEPVVQQASPPASPTWTTEGGLPFYDDDGRLERREPFEPTNDGRKPRYVPNRLGLPSTWIIPLL